jgi:hypothetical protein
LAARYVSTTDRNVRASRWRFACFSPWGS